MSITMDLQIVSAPVLWEDAQFSGKLKNFNFKQIQPHIFRVYYLIPLYCKIKICVIENSHHHQMMLTQKYSNVPQQTRVLYTANNDMVYLIFRKGQFSSYKDVNFYYKHLQIQSFNFKSFIASIFSINSLLRSLNEG